MPSDLKQWLECRAAQYVAGQVANMITPQQALAPPLAGLQIFDAPLLGFGRADDPLFDTFLSPQIIGPHYLTPKQWMPGSVSVVSFFLPFTAAVRHANRQNFSWPALAWLHARIEGQALVTQLARHLCKGLQQRGYTAMIPLLDERFRIDDAPFPGDRQFRFGNTTNWSERHAAYVCGLGTFSLSRALITRRGTAGRLGSLLTDAPIEPDERPYRTYDAYCTHCGTCIRHCPVGAITLQGGKSNALCGRMVMDTNIAYGDYYGCGKCQVAVPCESAIPGQPTDLLKSAP